MAWNNVSDSDQHVPRPTRESPGNEWIEGKNLEGAGRKCGPVEKRMPKTAEADDNWRATDRMRGHTANCDGAQIRTLFPWVLHSLSSSYSVRLRCTLDLAPSHVPPVSRFASAPQCHWLDVEPTRHSSSGSNKLWSRNLALCPVGIYIPATLSYSSAFCPRLHYLRILIPSAKRRLLISSAQRYDFPRFMLYFSSPAVFPRSGLPDGKHVSCAITDAAPLALPFVSHFPRLLDGSRNKASGGHVQRMDVSARLLIRPNSALYLFLFHLALPYLSSACGYHNSMREKFDDNCSRMTLHPPPSVFRANWRAHIACAFTRQRDWAARKGILLLKNLAVRYYSFLPVLIFEIMLHHAVPLRFFFWVLRSEKGLWRALRTRKLLRSASPLTSPLADLGPTPPPHHSPTMDVKNRNVPASKGIDPAEAAAADVWAIYVAEAEKYDKGLVESWSSDMQGMLIFAGLFSASLTAFLIESYKTLNPDSGDTTVKLLAQISHQLAASAQGSMLELPTTSTDFTPSPAALVCNALWFISLGLSLSCALFATLLEQWARDFIHRTEIRSAPIIRARIFSFLYYGLKRFNMHMLVDIIPLLLHLALFFFFAGLIAFLIPVNLGMAILAGGILLILTAAYSVLTLFPLAYLQSPYHTPLSGTFWRLIRYAKHWRHGNSNAASMNSPGETIMEAVSRVATKESGERIARDKKALVWTLKSLSDDQELEPFVAAIPDILWGPNHPRDKYTAVFCNLAVDADLGLCSRIGGLLAGCDTGVLLLDARKRRQIICYKAVWAITALMPDSPSSSVFVDSVPHVFITDSEVFMVAISVWALLQWSCFRADAVLLHEHEQFLIDSQRTDRGNISEPELTRVLHSITQVLSRSYARSHYAPTPVVHRTSEAHIQLIQRLLMEGPYRILFHYILSASWRQRDTLPYRFYLTSKLILPFPRAVPLGISDELDQTLDELVSTVLKEHNTSDVACMDELIYELISCWSPSSAKAIPRPLVQFIAGRASDDAVSRLITSISDVHQIGDSISQALLNETAEAGQKQLITAIWRLCYLLGILQDSSLRLLHLVKDLETSSMSPSLIALLKWQYLNKLNRGVSPLAASDFSARFGDPLLPSDTAIIPEPYDGGGQSVSVQYRVKLSDRITEAKVLLVAEFLESCAGSGPFPYMAGETLRRIIGAVQDNLYRYYPDRDYYPMAVHDTHQNRFANAIRDAFCSPRCAELRSSIIQQAIFGIYEEPQLLEEFGKPWMTNSAARETIRTAFTGYAGELAASTEHGLQTNSDQERIRAILRGFDLFHAIEAGAEMHSVPQKPFEE
ncbi:hypothetical protein DFH06DRAFT_1295820 [Mycena polygramma]|nr:hypothetical protein DFH06DRAFT_1295820 [Mycena polygramma]